MLEIDASLIRAMQSLRVSSDNALDQRQLLLQVGQQVLAKVLSIQNNNLATLLINDKTIQARAQIALQPGQLIELLVEKHDDEIVLKPTDHEVQHQILKQQLRETLPRTQSLDQTFARLTQLLRESATRSILPNEIKQVIKQALNNLPDSNEIKTPHGLKNIVKNSGMFTEKNLANALTNKTDPKSALLNDVKAQLTQLRDQIQQFRDQLDPAKTTTPAETAKPDTTAPTAKLSNPTENTPTDEQQSASENDAQEKLETITKLRTADPSATTKSDAKSTSEKSDSNSHITTTQRSSSSSTSPNARTGVVNVSVSIAAKTASPLTQLNSPIGTSDESLSNQTVNNAIARTTTKVPLPKSHAPYEQEQVVSQAESNARSRLAAERSMLLDTLEQLVKNVDSALSRTQLHQLQNTQESEQGRLAWTFEIPLRNGERFDLLKMRIERDAPKDKQRAADAPLTVTLGVDLEHIGPIHAKVVLIKSRVSVSFWAEREATYQLVAQNLEDLSTRLQQSGLNTERLVAHHGQPPHALDPALPLTGLLDINV